MERSIPPLIITNISPTALIPAKDIWRIKVLRFPNVMKFGAINENRITKKTRIRKGTFFFRIVPNRMPKFLRDSD
jgi:hypothetical protein